MRTEGKGEADVCRWTCRQVVAIMSLILTCGLKAARLVDFRYYRRGDGDSCSAVQGEGHIVAPVAGERRDVGAFRRLRSHVAELNKLSLVGCVAVIALIAVATWREPKLRSSRRWVR